MHASSSAVESTIDITPTVARRALAVATARASLVTLLAFALAACPSPPAQDAADADATSDINPTDGPPPDALASCDALCAAAATRCTGTVDAAACVAACASTDAGTSPMAVRACLASSDAAMRCSAARACLRPPPAVPFSAGPYGTHPREIAGDFTLPTTDGDWVFRDEWTGTDNYLFLVYAPGAVRFSTTLDYSVDLFNGSVTDLLAASPPNTHYVFLWLRNQPDFDSFTASALTEIGALSPEDQAHWRPRVHFVTTRADMLDGWPGDLVRARLHSTDMVKRYEPYQWAIDRTQHVREVGQLGRLVSGGVAAELPFLASESVYYNFEYEREQALAARPATVVQLLRDETVVETTYPEVTLPDPAMMATFDTLEVDLTMNCVNHRDGDCGAWDYISDLRLCEDPGAGGGGDAGGTDGAIDGGPASDADDATVTPDASTPDATTADAAPDGSPDAAPPPPRCDTEIARWITSYWREGRWVTDISSMLPFLRAGGRQRFRWYASHQWDPRAVPYVVSLSLRFSNRARGMRPAEVRPLWQGGALNTAYNTSHTPVSFTVPDGVRRVELYALITGHGSETSQCAEFCNHAHHFAINGTDHMLAFPEAQTPDGCRNRVDAGVVPNQHGTWYFGRGGWCPGGDVAPFVADLTAELRPTGTANELTYTAMVNRALPSPGRNYGNIDLSTYLVFWR